MKKTQIPDSNRPQEPRIDNRVALTWPMAIISATIALACSVQIAAKCGQPRDKQQNAAIENLGANLYSVASWLCILIITPCL
jgi:hypothetical protein